MREQSDFFISSQEKDNLVFEEHVENLRNFLISRAEAAFHDQKLESRAEKLKIKRQTYAKWLREQEKSTKRDRQT